MTDAVDQRRRQLYGPVAAPLTPEQEARVREIVREREDQAAERSAAFGGLLDLIVNGENNPATIQAVVQRVAAIAR